MMSARPGSPMAAAVAGRRLSLSRRRDSFEASEYEASVGRIQDDECRVKELLA